MNSMKRTSTSCSRPNRARSTISSSLTPRSMTALILTGEKPASFAASMPSSTRSNSSRRVISRNRSARNVSRLMLTRSRPASRSSCATSRNVAPLVVSERSGFWPASGELGRRRHAQRRQLADEHRHVGAHRRLAAGEAQAVDLEPLDEDPRAAARSPRRSAPRYAAATSCPPPACSTCSGSCSDR